MKELPDRWRELGEFIRDQRSTARLSLRRLSELAGVSNPYLSQIERGLRKPSADILQQIARALRISAETLYVRAGILEEPDTDHDVVDHILRDPYLTEEQKQTLRRVYLSFRHENGGRPVSPKVSSSSSSPPGPQPRLLAEAGPPSPPGAVSSTPPGQLGASS